MRSLIRDILTFISIGCLGVSMVLVAGLAIANGRAGDTSQISDLDDIDKRTLRADINYAHKEADRWDVEDHAHCAAQVYNPLSFDHRSYTRCMQRQSNIRILFMLRRGCLGALNVETCETMGVK